MIKELLLFFIFVYQTFISPLLGNCCRFEPSCSAYCQEAIEKYGAKKGLALSIRRLLRCRPKYPGGKDLVP